MNKNDPQPEGLAVGHFCVSGMAVSAGRVSLGDQIFPCSGMIALVFVFDGACTFAGGIVELLCVAIQHIGCNNGIRIGDRRGERSFGFGGECDGLTVTGADDRSAPVGAEDLHTGITKSAGKLDEVFGTGTAAVISPVGELKWDDHVMTINNGEIGKISQKLYDSITGIQSGKIEDTMGWTVKV